MVTADAEAARKARRLIGFMLGAVLRDPRGKIQHFDGPDATACQLAQAGAPRYGCAPFKETQYA
jgi:hypothetical protein